MNLKAKFVISIALLSSLSLVLPGSLRAGTIYAYTGNTYTTCIGTYASSGTTCAGSYALSLTFDVMAGTSLANLAPGTDITSDVSSFSFTDGAALSLTPLTNANATGFDFQIGTNASGEITSWLINADFIPFLNGTELSAETLSDAPVLVDQTFVEQLEDGAAVSEGVGSSYTLGNWTMTVTPTPMPEPSSLLLVGFGLLGLLALAARSKRHASRASW
ncbi:MAG: PEP-CTERM sorting domain-containing protein [Candidatus Acidiferrales bacterium]